MKLSIRKKILFSFGALISFFMFLNTINYSRIKQISKAKENVLKTYELYINNEHIIVRLLQQYEALGNFVFTKDASYIERYKRAVKRMGEAKEKVRASISGEDTIAIMKKIDNLDVQNAQVFLEQIVLAVQANGTDKITPLVVQAGKFTHELYETIEELDELIDKRIADAESVFQRTIKAAHVTLFLFILFGSLFGIVTSLAICNNIIRPINTLLYGVEKINEGDLTNNVTVNSNDEIGNLAKSFNSMSKHLKEILGKTQEAANSINSSGQEILTTLKQQIVDTRDQSLVVTQTSSAVKGLSVAAEQIGENIKEVAQSAAHALTGMAKIKEAMSKANSAIISLGERSQQIGKITELINDVADQTNLLAINASIEAARAGEQGRGFTVVADEIRKLSDSTSKSTKNITTLIDVIQHELSNSILSMKISTSTVEEEVKLSYETVEKTKKIAITTVNQVFSSKQIVETMVNIDKSMKQIVLNTQQSQLTIEQLNELASKLRELALRFKIN